jgi:hypothetical protein
VAAAAAAAAAVAVIATAATAAAVASFPNAQVVATREASLFTAAGTSALRAGIRMREEARARQIVGEVVLRR